MFCPKCGTQLPDGAGFCTNCGAAAESPRMPVTDTSNQKTIVIPPIPKDVPPVQNDAPPVVPDYEPPTEERTGNGGRIALIVAICVLIIGILAALVFLLLPGLMETEDIDGGSRRPSHSSVKNNTTDEKDATVPESNIYYEAFVDADSYVLPDSDSKYFSHSELSSMTRQQLYLAERELFARYGGTFSDGDLAQYFEAKSWYTPDSPAENFNESRFNEYERVNLLLLRALLMERDGTTASNPYTKVNNDVEGWILNFTDVSRIAKEDVQNLTETELFIARNEILARKGYIFEDHDLQLYFSGKNWYTPTTQPGSFDMTTALNEVESENYSCLQKCENKVKGVRFSAGNKFKDVYNDYYGQYLFAASDSYKIDPFDLQNMNAEELSIARNEIYARHGYSYNNTDFVEYFANCSWYYPTVATDRLDLIHLSDVEEYNVKMIQAFELNYQLRFGKGNPNTKMSYYAKHDFMTMYLPEHWRANCKCVKPTGLSGNLEFYELYNYDKNGHGWVFSMELIPTDRSLPSYSGCDAEVKGTVTTPDGKSYYVVIVTSYGDEQFLEHVYMLMQSQIDTIWESVEWKSGYTFTPA